MYAQPVCRPLDVVSFGPVTVVRFPRSVYLEGEDAESIGEYLFGLVLDAGHCRLVINCEHVEMLSSAMLGKLILLHKKALPLGGRLALCHVPPKLFQIVDTVKLNALVGIYESEADAVRSYAPA